MRRSITYVLLILIFIFPEAAFAFAQSVTTSVKYFPLVGAFYADGKSIFAYIIYLMAVIGIFNTGLSAYKESGNLFLFIAKVIVSLAVGAITLSIGTIGTKIGFSL